MGTHTDPWAIDVIQKIRHLGNSLGYITAFEEKRITRGWVDICWVWKIPIFQKAVFLLVAEVETSKSNWPRIRNNAAKAVELKPLIYAHIFKPNVRLTPEERHQLLEIHHGRHVLIFDGTSNSQQFLDKLRSYDQWYFRNTLCAFALVQLDGRVSTFKVQESLLQVPGVVVVYAILGFYDFLVVLPLKDFAKVKEAVSNLGSIPGVGRTATFFALQHFTQEDPV